MNGMARVGVAGLASSVCLGELLEPVLDVRGAAGGAGRKAAMALEPAASKD